MRKAGHLAYIAALAMMAFVGLAYEDLSSGLAFPDADGPFFCRDLFSSGGDDDAMIGSFGIFLAPLALRLLRLNRAVARYEIVLFWICAGLVCLSLMLASTDCASIFYTAFVLPDPLLAGALIALPLAAFLVMRPLADG